MKHRPFVFRAQLRTFRFNPPRCRFVQKMIRLVGHSAHAGVPEVLRPICDAFVTVFHTDNMGRLRFNSRPTM